jgi:hypothetical protein
LDDEVAFEEPILDADGTAINVFDDSDVDVDDGLDDTAGA